MEIVGGCGWEWGCNTSGKGGMEERKKKKYMSVIMTACFIAMCCKHTPGTHAHSWWTNACSLVAQAVWMARDDEHEDAVWNLHCATLHAK